MIKLPLIMDGVREYAEGYEVQLEQTKEGRFVVVARNEGGYNCTEVDLTDLIGWVEKHQSQIWNEV